MDLLLSNLPDAVSQLRTIFQASSDLLFILDGQGTILDYKAGDPDLLFVSPESFLGRQMQDILPAEVGEKFSTGIQRLRWTGESVTIDYALTISGRRLWFEARLAALPPRHILVIVRDIGRYKDPEVADAIVEGWSRALNLRDRDTEGHTRRVTQLALKLARHMAMDEASLVHIRRGAILHDIGKVAIPDSILLKRAPLTAEEWLVMRLHPLYARDMLSPIPALAPAIDIPQFHHEKWNGHGYPDGLQGEDIPLTARIFAVVDVFDALTSDRPYRPAWTRAQALDYIQAQAGAHFAPQIAAQFLGMLARQSSDFRP